ncbi:hypothetical protein G7046_g1102 [Stylonectria norvegica]|nr:hypothetical protein G7046_g1102 [Stylonectria norvegica]
MWGWFGGAAAQKRKDTPKNAIIGLRSQLDMLQKREKHLQGQIDECNSIARKNATTNKSAALAALRRRRNHDQSLGQTTSQIGTLEQQINAIESANINRETLAAMEKAGEAMKQIHGKLTPEKVDETMEKLREQTALSEEIVQAITSGSVGNDFEDEDLEAELDELQQEQLDEQMLNTGNVPVSDAVHKMPTPANAEPVSSKKQAIEEDDEEAELRKLQAEMAMTTSAYRLPIDISNFVPSCAEDCFISFLNVNYGTTKCGTNPSMQCLCSHLGPSDLTLGEGAVQCIAAERTVGFCSDIEASGKSLRTSVDGVVKREAHLCIDAVIQNAFQICAGQPNAFQPTRDTLTVTLVMPPSGGIITFSPITTAKSTKSTPLPTTLVIDTSEPPTQGTASPTSTHTRPSPYSSRSSHSSSSTSRSSSRSTTDYSSFITSTISSEASLVILPTPINSFSETASSAASTSTNTDVPAGAGSSTDGLSKDQVAGISVGVLAAAGFAIGAILLARYCRRRNHPHVKTGFLPMRDTWGFKAGHSGSGGGSGSGSGIGSGSGRGGRDSWMAKQIHAPLDTCLPPPPPSYNRASYKPESIGLAISPPHSRVTTQTSTPRRLSRLLPAKPVLPFLPLNIQKRFSRSSPRQSSFVTVPEEEFRSSRYENLAELTPPTIMGPTPYASPTRSKPPPPAPPKLQIPTSSNLMAAPPEQNGRESTMTEFEEDGRASLSPGTQVWRPPATPLSANTYYVAGPYGNWVLGDPKRHSQIAPASATVASKPPPRDGDVSLGASKPSNLEAGPRPQNNTSLAPPAEISRADSSSSIYTHQSTAIRGPYPYPLFSAHPNPPPRRNSSTRHSLQRNLTRPRAESTDSGVTTITTSSEDTMSDPSPPLETQGNLSPVVESPENSRAGHSPVSYPRIPSRDPRRISGVMNAGPGAHWKPVYPPARQVAYYPPGQPSPTLGMMQPPANPGPTSYNVPGKGRRPVENAGLERTGSPTMRIVEPSPEPDDVRGNQPPSMKPRTPAFYFDPPYPRPLNENVKPQRPFQPSRTLFPHPRPDRQKYRPYQPPEDPPNPDFHSEETTSNASSSSSSLLAKRLGNDRAANMTIPTDPVSASQSKWRRDGQQRGETSTPKRDSGLPPTPGWMPRLTPTRRGQDLFLNVR